MTDVSGCSTKPGRGSTKREGIAKAKAQGRYKGRVPTAQRQAGEIVRLKSEGIKPSEIARKLGVGRASVYRVLGDQGASG